MKLQLKLQVDTSDGLPVSSSFNLKKVVSKETDPKPSKLQPIGQDKLF